MAQITDDEPARILIADDEAPILESYRHILQPAEAPATDNLADLERELFGASEAEPATIMSYDLTMCRQGQEAVDAVRQALVDNRPYSVAFLDVRMPPGINGVQAAEQIRGLDPAIKIVIVTGFSDVHPDDIRRRIGGSDNFEIITKPFNGGQIEDALSVLSPRAKATPVAIPAKAYARGWLDLARVAVVRWANNLAQSALPVMGR